MLKKRSVCEDIICFVAIFMSLCIFVFLADIDVIINFMYQCNKDISYSMFLGMCLSRGSMS